MPLFGPPNIEKLKARRDVKGLITALDFRHSTQIRRAAAEALGKLGDARCVQPLLSVTRDHDTSVGEAAEQALAELGEVAIEPLVRALVSKNSWEWTIAQNLLPKPRQRILDAVG